MPEIEIALPKLHPKQLMVWDSKATEILFAGDTRAGKSYFFRRAYIYYCSLIPGLITDIFRLFWDDVISENMTGETSFPVLLNAWEREGLCKINQADITFWNTSKISLHHCSDDNAVLKHRGNACHVRTFSESAQILEHRIRALCGWVTMSNDMKDRVPERWKGQFPKIFHGTNPNGISAGYYRRAFVDCRPPMTIEKVGPHLRQYIPAFVDDNPSENADDTRARVKESFVDVAVQKSFINDDKTGITNWHQVAGDFYPEWDISRHVVTDCLPPHSWFRFRGMDLGYAEPFCVYWVAVSDGEPFYDSDGHERWFPRGAFLVYREWYGCDQANPAIGIRLRNEDIAAGIIARSEVDAGSCITLTDSLPFQDRGGEGPALVFQRCGVPLTLGDTSRVTGWSAFRGRLIGKEVPGYDTKLPMIYFCESCFYAQSYIPALQRHPSEAKKEDAMEHGEATHSPDTLRIICMAHTVIKDNPHMPSPERLAAESKLKRVTMNRILAGAGHQRL